MDLRFFRPDWTVSAPFLLIGALLFGFAYRSVPDTGTVDAAALVILVGLVWGTAVFYARDGLAASLTLGALEAACILGAVAASQFVPVVLFGCGPSAASTGRKTIGLVVFAVVYMVVSAFLKHSRTAELRRPWFDDETDGERRVAMLVGGASAIGLVAFLGSALVGSRLTGGELDRSWLWNGLGTVGGKLAQLPVLSNDLVAALQSILGGPEQSVTSCSSVTSAYDQLEALANQNMAVGLFFWAVFLTPLTLLLLRPVLKHLAHRPTGLADLPPEAYRPALVRYAFVTCRPGIFLAIGGVVLALLSQGPAEGAGYLENSGIVVWTACLYVVSEARSARVLNAAYRGSREASLRVGLEMIISGVLIIPAFLVFAHYTVDEPLAFAVLAAVLVAFGAVQCAGGCALISPERWTVSTVILLIIGGVILAVGSKVVSSGGDQEASGPAGAPRTLALPVVATNPFAGEEAAERPDGIGLSANGNVGLEQLQWTQWSPTRATGSGRWREGDCVPNCSSGTMSYYPVQVTLTSPELSCGKTFFARLAILFTADVPPGGNSDRLENVEPSCS